LSRNYVRPSDYKWKVAYCWQRKASMGLCRLGMNRIWTSLWNEWKPLRFQVLLVVLVVLLILFHNDYYYSKAWTGNSRALTIPYGSNVHRPFQISRFRWVRQFGSVVIRKVPSVWCHSLAVSFVFVFVCC
jgi:hypothetical protein